MKTYWPSIILISSFFISTWPFFSLFDLPLAITISQSGKNHRLNLPFFLTILLGASVSREPLFLVVLLLLPFAIQYIINLITTGRNLFISTSSVDLKVMLTYTAFLIIKVLFFNLQINSQFLTALLPKVLLTMLLALFYAIKVSPWISGQSSFSH